MFTNHSGLYRYRMGDMIEVAGWYGQSPVVQFCYRKNQLLNLAGEKTNREQLDKAIGQFALAVSGGVTGYCVREDASGILPRYVFYLECTGAGPAWAEELLDACLCRANYSYRGCRQMSEISQVRISCLREGGFDRYPLGYTAIGIAENYVENARNIITKGERATEYLCSYSEESGAHTTAAIAVYNSGGEIVAMLGVEKAMTRLEAARSTCVKDTLLGVLAVVLLFPFAYSTFLYREILLPVFAVTGEAKRFADSNTPSDKLCQGCFRKNSTEKGAP